MIGRHRGSRSLRWRLVNAVISAALGRGYQGRHRFEAAVLGLPVAAAGPAAPGTAPVGACVQTIPVVTGPALARPVASVPSTVTLASGARLTVVPVAASADPLVDTVPHPVVKLFPLPIAESTADGEQAVFDDVDQARDEQVTAALAAGAAPPSSYHGRHSA